MIFGRFSTFFAEVVLRETNLGFAISLYLSRAWNFFPKMMFCLEGKMFEKVGLDSALVYASTLTWAEHSLLQTCFIMWMLLLDVWMMRSVNLSQTVFMFYLLLINENFTFYAPLRVPTPHAPTMYLNSPQYLSLVIAIGYRFTIDVIVELIPGLFTPHFFILCFRNLCTVRNFWICGEVFCKTAAM